MITSCQSVKGLQREKTGCVLIIDGSEAESEAQGILHRKKAAVEDEKRSAAISEENALRAIGVKGYPSSIDDRRSGGERDVGEKGRFY